MNLATLPDCRADAAPHAAAVADEHTDLTNIGFLDAVRRATTSLRAAGVAPGAVVAVMLPNTADLVVSLFAAWRAGAAVTLIDPALPAGDAGDRMARAGAGVLIAARELACVYPVRCVVSADRLTGAVLDTSEPARACDDTPALLVHTEGTADHSKIVTLDHLNLNALCRLAIEIFALADTDHSLSILPLFRIDGIALGILSPLLSGGRATVAEPAGPAVFLDRIERTHATYISAAPSVYTQLSDLPADTQPNTSSVRVAVCGTVQTGLELQGAFEHRYGIPIIHDHGLTEFPARPRSFRPSAPMGQASWAQSSRPR
ncbi:AMP-binding protein [Nocardia jinanensis]|uniref:AMP-dependent synthetase/ligase domain-containing protein n=1 Tax=Nocardia jinanensis TaxID=382504 RepID=A0A917RS41_9NOCA|nr:AMP-binding protein [Nocardia jinanensis]GGL19738.1 hypothetical protein GCM10011588_38030 [Nocardia jinanensis]